MGEVYLAHDTKLDRPVALKVMSAELAHDPNQRRRFRTEARAASGLSHPNICAILELGETPDSRPFLAMEFVDGRSLDVLLRHRKFGIRETIALGITVAEALHAAHQRGLVHRDIKPANLMVDKSRQVKVMDFGLAKWYSGAELSPTATSMAQTRTGMLIGTPQYMSPEQALGQTLDPRSDIFSLGVVLYEMLVGQRPFLGKTVAEVINNIINQPPPPTGLDDSPRAPALEQIVFKCLEKQPERRYASAGDLAADLRKLESSLPQGQESSTRRSARLPQPGSSSGVSKRNRVLLCLGIAFLLALLFWVLL